MDRRRLEGNLQRLQQNLTSHAQALGISPSIDAQAASQKIAASIYLAHSTSARNFDAICGAGSLLSPHLLDVAGTKALKSDAVERALGTTESVFLYAGAFSFPSGGCGVLFSGSLEIAHSSTGAASPFDSGGLVHHFRRADMAEPVMEFFLRHELPLFEHREFLQNCLSHLFSNPFDYVEGIPPVREGIVGLTGGDVERRHVHEVRIPHEVKIRSSHLKAVFVPLRLALQPSIEKLLTWCAQEGFDVESFEADEQNDFTKLKTACIQYLRTRLL